MAFTPSSPAARSPHLFGDAPRQADIAARRLRAAAGEVDVVRNEELTRSHRTGPGPGMQLRSPHIRPPGRHARRVPQQPLELPTPHVLQVHPVRPRRRRLVEVHRNADTAARSPPRPAAPASRTAPARARSPARTAPHPPLRSGMLPRLPRQVDQLAPPRPRRAPPTRTTASGVPAMVTTDRLCAASSDQSSRCTPSTRMARTIARTFSGLSPLGEVRHTLDDGTGYCHCGTSEFLASSFWLLALSS